MEHDANETGISFSDVRDNPSAIVEGFDMARFVRLL